MTSEINNFRQEQTAFDHGIFQVALAKGIATPQSADITQDKNQFHLRGSAELPRDIHDFGRAPATVDLAATLPELERVTAAMPQPISGSAEIAGKLNIKNSILDGDFKISAPSAFSRLTASPAPECPSASEETINCSAGKPVCWRAS